MSEINPADPISEPPAVKIERIHGATVQNGIALVVVGCLTGIGIFTPIAGGAMLGAILGLIAWPYARSGGSMHAMGSIGVLSALYQVFRSVHPHNLILALTVAGGMLIGCADTTALIRPTRDALNEGADPLNHLSHDLQDLCPEGDPRATCVRAKSDFNFVQRWYETAQKAITFADQVTQ